VRKTALLVLALSVSCVSLTACQQHRTFGQKVQDAVDPPKTPLQQAGRSIDRATGD